MRHLTVPLDHADPAGATIDLALVRVPAAGDRKGAVLFNPGGPGGSGFTPIANSGTFLAEALGLDEFDLIGFDPRGVDRSNGLRCLDSAYEPNGDTVEQQFETQLVGFEGAFDNWAAWCEADATCAFHAPDVGARWDELLQRLDDQPLTAAGGRRVNQSTMGSATVAALYAESQWPVLAGALRAAEAGDPAPVLALADDYRGRNPDGTYDTLFQSLRVIDCASGLGLARPPDPEALLGRLQRLAPRFAKSITTDDLTQGFDGCARMVGEVTATTIDYPGDAPIVVVGGTNDPATPLRWAEEMTAALGPGARLVTYTGEGHGQLLVSTCVTDIESNVLTRLELPPDGTVCEPDPPVERPDWWDEVPVPAGVSDVVLLPALSTALGLTPTLAYSEYRTTTASASDVADAYADALAGTAFTAVGRLDLAISGAVQAAWFAPNGDLFVLLAFGPDAFADPLLAGAAPSMPPGTTVVTLIYLPQ